VQAPFPLAPLDGHIPPLLSAVAAPTLHDHLDPSDASKDLREVLVQIGLLEQDDDQELDIGE